jgi:hypothetical protein
MSAMFRGIRALAPAAVGFALASLVLIVADLVLVAFGARVDQSNAIGRSGAIDVGSALASLSFAGVGLVLSTTRAGHGMGTLLQLIGLAIAVSLFCTGYASHALVADPTLPAAMTMMWLASWIWQPMANLALFFLPVLFPDGRLPSARWRWVAIASIMLAVAGSIGPAFLDGPMQPPFQTRLNPVGIPQAHALMDTLIRLAYVGATILPTAGIAAVVMRYRRAQALERAQLRWFIASAIPLIVAFAITGFAYGQLGLEPIAALGTILVVVGLIGVPTAIGFAVLRYRLYEVDLLVNRAVLYGGVTVILIGAFGVANIAAQRLATALTGERSELVAAALGVVATLSYGPLAAGCVRWWTAFFPLERCSRCCSPSWAPLNGSSSLATSAGESSWIATVRRSERRCRAGEVVKSIRLATRSSRYSTGRCRVCEPRPRFEPGCDTSASNAAPACTSARSSSAESRSAGSQSMPLSA